MNAKKIVGWILQVPVYLLVLGSFGASIYAAANKIQNINWNTPLIMGGIIIAFLVGAYLKHIANSNNNNKKEPQMEKVYENEYENPIQ